MLAMSVLASGERAEVALPNFMPVEIKGAQFNLAAIPEQSIHKLAIRSGCRRCKGVLRVSGGLNALERPRPKHLAVMHFYAEKRALSSVGAGRLNEQAV